MKIRFIEPGNRPYKKTVQNWFIYDKYIRTPSNGILTLATILKREYEDVFCYSESISEIKWDDVLDADIICISIFTFNANRGYELAEYIRTNSDGRCRMSELHKRFLDTIQALGMLHLEHHIFYNAPIGIRFEIGGDEEVYLKEGEANPAYVSKALDRAKTIYNSLPDFDILRIDIYIDEREFSIKTLDLSDFTDIGLPLPRDRVVEEVVINDEKYKREHLYWDLSKQGIDEDILLEEIIKADIGGFNELVSSVFFISTEVPVMYHLYDDRGLDVVAKEKESLLPLYENFHIWILDDDR